jgi:predicted unusual protein kinase regulating ubiquinone biosynthesis (AarF/ABC1/UbiB family)
MVPEHDGEASSRPGNGAPAFGQSPRRLQDVLAPIPRRTVVAATGAQDAMPPMAKVVVFEAGVFRAAWRFLAFLGAGLGFALGTLLDLISARDSLDRRAQRFRRILERGSPGFVKIGQHLAFRADLLPLRFCEELTEMRDVAPAFDASLALALIEKAAGKPALEVFAVFDPTPILATSTACVYQAVLPTGQQVAVKVRRPGVGFQIAADLRALGWLLQLAESVALVRPGRTRSFRDDLRAAVFESLNYTLEGRYAEIFGSRAKKREQDHIHSLEVFFELSSEEVLVTEFVSGVFLWEILDAVERDDEEALVSIAAKGVDPVMIAQHLTRSFYWEALENIFFHADPHPTRIVARADNSLVFIDFASCGRFSEKIKRCYQELQAYIAGEDVGGMVEATISMLEPLPPMDLDRFTKDVEGLYWDWLYATKSRQAPWWERSTGELWMKVVEMARRYGVPVHLDILRLFRATFHYDGMAMRLWDRLKLDREYRAYSRERGRRARRRLQRAMRRRMEKGLTKSDYLQVQDLGRLVTQVVNRAQHVLDRPTPHFAGMIGKAAFGVSIVLKILIVGAALHVVAVLTVSLLMQSAARGAPVDVPAAIALLVHHPAYQVTVALSFLVVTRRALMRLEDIDVHKT